MELVIDKDTIKKRENLIFGVIDVSKLESLANTHTVKEVNTLKLDGNKIKITTMRNDYEDFKVAAEFIAELIQKLDAYKIPPKTILNINVPGLDKEDIAGIAVTELGGKMFTNAYERRVDPRGKVYYWMAGELIRHCENDDSDLN